MTKVFSTRAGFLALHELGFYFRIFGYGAAVSRDTPVLFSERNGYRKMFRLARWSFEWLTP